MAIKFPKLPKLPKFTFYKNMGARSRVALLIAGVAVIIFVMYLTVRYLTGTTTTTGASSINAGPGEIASVPGGQLTPEYYRALQQSNTQAAEQAKVNGTSAIPTLIKTGPGATDLGQSLSPSSNCTICSDDSVNVKNTLDGWVSQGQLSPEVSSQLQQLSDKGLSVDEYAAELDKLVKANKLLPDQARRLLEEYKKQRANADLTESSKLMDDLIKNGNLPLDVANDLLLAQKNKVSPAEYAAMLDNLVKSGKISADTAKTLLAQYTQQRAKSIVAAGVASLDDFARNGEITPEVQKTLADLQRKMVPVSDYEAALNKFVSEGKLVPATAAKLLAAYKAQKAAIGSGGLADKMLKDSETAAYGEINDMVKTGDVKPEAAAKLTDLIQKDVPLEDYIQTVRQMEQQKLITPDAANRLIASYKAVKGLRAEVPILTAMQDKNASLADYKAELQRAVSAGQITPDQAKQLLDEYQSLKTVNALATSGPVGSTAPGNSDFARLQQRLQQASASEEPVQDNFTAASNPPAGTPGVVSVMTPEEMARQRQIQEQQAQQEAQAIQSMAAAMANQAQQLVGSWQPPTMEVKVGTGEEKTTTETTTQSSSSSSGSNANGSAIALAGPPVIKAGTIIFAVLDTAVNSDFPDSPVLATVVEGKYKGAKMMGKLSVTKGVSGQLDRVSLNFTLMNMEDWDKSLSVTAFGIDPDTAHTVLASSVDYHYLQRFGAIMATSFMQGYASAITNAGTSTTGIFGTSTTHPELSPSQKIATALGQMGQTLGAATQNYINIPPTVKVNSGVGLGILFMSDVTNPISVPTATSSTGSTVASTSTVVSRLAGAPAAVQAGS
jgi:type IV secretory pathway VirB10-like protein